MLLNCRVVSSPSGRSAMNAFFHLRCSIPDKLKKSQKRKTKHNHQNKQTKRLPFPKSSPTPILISQKPLVRTKRQALESLVDDLESSAKNGVSLIADAQMFSSILETCYQLGALDVGIRVHRLIPSRILRKNAGVASKLLRLYAAIGRMDDAHQVFDEMPKRDETAFAWNSMISGYADVGKFEDALALYLQMEEEGVEPDSFTFPRALKACSGLGSIRVGEEIHRHVIRYGYYGNVTVLNALVDMYAKCGDIVRAREVFDKIGCRDLVSWNSMITGYVHHDLVFEALDVFKQMIDMSEVEPDEVTISVILTGVVTSLRLAREIHGWVVRRGREGSLAINNALITLFSNHGLLVQSRWIFDHMLEKDTVSWNSIISAHSKDPQALMYFRKMEEDSDARADVVTFVSLLSTCAHLKLVEDGERVFSLMKGKYRVLPTMEHYACMVNLYARAGLIREAYEIVRGRMEFEAGPTVWGALLYGCYLHKNDEIGEIAAQKLFELEPDNEHNFELLIKIYERLGKLDEAMKVKRMLVDRGLDLWV